MKAVISIVHKNDDEGGGKVDAHGFPHCGKKLNPTPFFVMCLFLL